MLFVLKIIKSSLAQVITLYSSIILKFQCFASSLKIRFSYLTIMNIYDVFMMVHGKKPCQKNVL